MTLRYHIADEEGYVYSVSETLIKDAISIFTGNTKNIEYITVPTEISYKVSQYLGDKLDHWKSLPVITAGNSFTRLGHIFTLRRE